MISNERIDVAEPLGMHVQGVECRYTTEAETHEGKVHGGGVENHSVILRDQPNVVRLARKSHK